MPSLPESQRLAVRSPSFPGELQLGVVISFVAKHRQIYRGAVEAEVVGELFLKCPKELVHGKERVFVHAQLVFYRQTNKEMAIFQNIRIVRDIPVQTLPLCALIGVASRAVGPHCYVAQPKSTSLVFFKLKQ